MHRAGTCVEHALRLFVGEAFVGVDDRLAEPAIYDIRLFVECKNSGDSEPVFTRVQGAEVSGKYLGEHRDGAVDEIDGGCAVSRLRIELRAWPDEEGDIGDMNTNLESRIRKSDYRQGIVEVLRVEGIDGHGRDTSEIAGFCISNSTHRLRRKHIPAFGFEPLRFDDDTGTEVGAESLAQGERAHLDVMLACASNNFLDDTPWVLCAVFPPLEMHKNFVTKKGSQTSFREG